MKIGLISLGCPKNLVDSEVMLGLAQQRRPRAHRRRRRRPTCSSSTPARSSIRPSRNRSTPFSRWREHKKNGACQRLVVTGCLAERYRDELQAEIPEIDAVLGTGEVPEIVARDWRHASAARSGRLPVTLLAATPHTLDRRSHPTSPSTSSHRTRPADLHLRRRHAAPARDAAALRLREDRRRLRLQVRVLHHPDAARRLSQPPGRLDRPRSAGAGRARRQGTAADLAGHDLLRHRPSASAARWPGCCAS